MQNSYAYHRFLVGNLRDKGEKPLMNPSQKHVYTGHLRQRMLAVYHWSHYMNWDFEAVFTFPTFTNPLDHIDFIKRLCADKRFLKQGVFSPRETLIWRIKTWLRDYCK